MITMFVNNVWLHEIRSWTAEYSHFQQDVICAKQPKIISAVRENTQTQSMCEISLHGDIH